MDTKSARKKYFIGTPVQKIFLFYSITMGLLSILLMRLHDFVMAIAGEQVVLVALSFGVFVVFVTYIILGLLLSNRIAGPLFHIQESLKKFTETGKAEPIKLREGDLFLDLAELVNEAMKKASK